MPIKRYLEAPPIKPLPAVARRWKLALQGAKEKGQQAFCRLDRARDGLVFRPAQLNLIVKAGDKDVEILDAPWDGNLNDWLVADHHVRAEDPAAEIERFGFALKERFAPVENRFGDGFFNAVLVHKLREEGFGDESPTKEKLKAVHEPHPARGEQAPICAEMIDDVLMGCNESFKALSYDEPAREKLLVGALAYYLDERFNITNSQLLGFR
jgi:hypothetical protein